MMAMPRLADAEALVWYEDLPGDEPAVVYIHGLSGASSGYMVGVARHPRLAQRRAILVDLPGHGYSDAPASYAYRLADHAAAVAAVLDHRGAAGLAGDPAAQLVSAVARVADRRALHRTSVELMRELDPPLWEQFAALPIPRAYLYGGLTLQDPAHVERAERLRARGIPVPIVPDVGHGMLDNPDAFPEAIADALALG